MVSCVKSVVLGAVFLLVCNSVSARIALPTSDYNNVELLKPEDAGAVSEQGSDVSFETAPGSDDDKEASLVPSAVPWTMGAIRVMRKVYLECRDEDLSSCLKVQIIRAMDRVARSTKKVSLMAGVTLERDPEFSENEKALSKDEIEATLPRSLPERERSLDKLILDRIFNFFQSYSLRFKLPTMAELNSSTEDARRRKGQMNGLMAMGMLLAGSLLPMKFGVLAMLAGKALMLSKLALVISTLMAMRNMGGGGGASGGGSSHHH